MVRASIVPEKDRTKIKGWPRPTKPPIKPLEEGKFIIETIGPRDERLLGRFVIAWSRVEAAAQSLVWAFLGLTPKDGKIVTSKMDVGLLLQVLRALATRNLRAEFLGDFLTYINIAEEIKDVRNLAVHGVWHFIESDDVLGPKKVPSVMSIRAKVEDGKSLGVTETFPEGRLARNTRASEVIRVTFAALEQQLLSSPETLLIQHPTD
jgi:hypothetical protein